MSSKCRVTLCYELASMWREERRRGREKGERKSERKPAPKYGRQLQNENTCLSLLKNIQESQYS